METFCSASEDPLKEAEEQGSDTKVETLSQGCRSLGQLIVSTPSRKVCSEVPAELSDMAENSTLLEELVDSVVEDVGGTMTEPQTMPPA